jgi:hypothetical protein
LTTKIADRIVPLDVAGHNMKPHAATMLPSVWWTSPNRLGPV